MKPPPSIFKAYDIRGIYPTELDPEVVAEIAVKLARKLRPRTVLLGRDARQSSPALFKAAEWALKEAPLRVISAGVMTTPMFYFLVNRLGADLGLMVTASHNPPEYNGLKIVRRKAAPLLGAEAYEIVRSTEL